MNVEINPSEYKVLIVDDVISNVLLLKVLLTNEKFNIVTAGNGTQALEQVKKEKPDLVLLDVMMPDMNGLQRCVRISFPIIRPVSKKRFTLRRRLGILLPKTS